MARHFPRLLAGLLALIVSVPAEGGFNATAPKTVRRIFTQLAFAEGRLVSYHVLEPGPQSIQAFPTGQGTGRLLRFPGCPELRPVLDDSAAPSPSADNLIPDLPMRKVVDVTLADCRTQPTSLADAARDWSACRRRGLSLNLDSNRRYPWRGCQ